MFLFYWFSFCVKTDFQFIYWFLYGMWHWIRSPALKWGNVDPESRGFVSYPRDRLQKSSYIMYCLSPFSVVYWNTAILDLVKCNCLFFLQLLLLLVSYLEGAHNQISIYFTSFILFLFGYKTLLNMWISCCPALFVENYLTQLIWHLWFIVHKMQVIYGLIFISLICLFYLLPVPHCLD